MSVEIFTKPHLLKNRMCLNSSKQFNSLSWNLSNPFATKKCRFLLLYMTTYKEANSAN